MSNRQWPLLIAGGAALSWLALAVALIVTLRVPGAFPPRLVIAGGIALALAAPVAVIALVALRLLDGRANTEARAARLAETAWATDDRIAEAEALLGGVEARVTALTAQLGDITKAVAGHDKAFAASAARLDGGATALVVAATTAATASAGLGERLPAATAQAEALRALLASTGSDLEAQIAATEALLAALGARTAELGTATNAAAATATDHARALESAATAAAAALTAPLAAIDASGAAMLARTATATETARSALDGHASALATTLGAAHAELAAINGQITAQADRYALFIEQLERGFATLDARLAASATTGQAGLDGIASAMVSARDAVNALAPAIHTSRDRVDDLVIQLTAITRTAGQAIAALDQALPGAEPRVAALATGLEELEGRAAALAAPIETAAAELAAARASLDAIETGAGSTTLAAAAQLADAFVRVRDIAGQTAGTMRTTLAGVVTEAEEALSAAATDRAEAAFAGPMRAALAEIAAANAHAADAAQAAAERVTQRLLALTATIGAVETRVAEVEDTQGNRLRADMATRSATLLASMEAASIDIAKLLGADLDENAWSKWLAGERGMFLRRAVRIADADTARDIARLWQGDSGFREAATRFIGEFEALIARVSPEREGRSLALALLSSDQGKLYVALSQATERLQ